ncbi:MAG: InlB B-repeat-containing protein [Paludibacteraceae bacterium]|nr:InlB B-repeat-containing protein [Paludibacteraceae bacterium]
MKNVVNRALGAKKKRFFQRNVFLKLLMVLLAICWSTSAVMAAPSYFRVEIIPVLENGAVGKLYACDYSSANSNYYNYLYNIGKDGLWTVCSDESTHWEQTIEHGAGGGVQFCPRAQAGDKRTMFEGWYWDAACTERLKSSSSGSVTYTNSSNFTVSGNGRTLTSYPSAAAAEAGTKIVIYAKFVKTVPDFDWSTLGVTPIDEGKYYIYNIATGRFLQAPKTGNGSSSNKPGTTANPAEATLFTCDSLTIGTNANYLNKKIDDNGVTENRSYKECLFTYKADDNVTRYASADGYSNWKWNASAATNINYKIHVWSWTSLGTDTFLIAKGDASGGTFISHFEVYSDGSLDYAAQGGLKRNNGFYWTFIPENALLSQSAVTSLNENGTVTIDASPTATGTAYVKFNVSSTSLPAGFNYELTGGDGHFDIVEESVTCSGGVLTVPVTYTAQNVHTVSSPASTATVTVTSKQGGDPVSGTVTAYVDLQPKFALMVNELDWNAEGETFYKGMEIAASQRTYLANKLIYNPAQTTGVAANNATWTATIEGTNANQFKFANGTQSVSGAYTSSLLDVIYAPTTTGSHTATLHIVTSYTASNGEQTYEKNITLLGTGSAASRITFAANGSETPLTAESYNYGDIIGTNHKDVTAELFISQITNPSYVWNDPAEVFELDESTIDLTKKNQTLSFRAHPDNPVATNTDYTATLTVSGKGTANEDVSAVLTLTYRALPLIQTTVTWNWETMKENRTVTNPITTNSDGVWVLTKTAGDAVTYNDASKSATAAYLHHEPGKTAAYILSIPQTDTYTAFEQEYETEIIPLPKHVVIDRQEYLGDDKAGTDGEYGKVSKWASSWESWDDATKTLQVKGDKIWFYFSGQTKFEFDFTERSGAWYLYEYDANNTQHTIWNTSYTPTLGHQVIDISPNTVKIEMKGNGKMTNIEYYEVDTISANYPQVALIRDGNNVSSLDVTATFSNKQVVTASLNATAAQYFTISSAGKATGSSFVFNGDDGLGLGLTQNKVITVALKDGVNVNEAQQASMGNTCVLTLSDDYTYNHEELSLPIVIVSPSEITYKHSDYGTYVVTYSDNVPHTVSSADYVKTITETDPALYVVTLSEPTPTASGYVFQGWKIGEELVSCAASFTTSIGRDCDVVALFDQLEGEYYKVGNVYYDDLARALSVAGNSAEDKVVTVMQDVTLGDGTTSISYTIPAGVTLLIPHKADYFSLQETPDVVRMANKEVLSAYRTLTLKEGVNIICNGNICVAGTLLSSNGGNKSAYTTDECGVINMANGGHIELNNHANLYCWGYIKGQDMDQGNNTQGTGTVTANAGSVVWENFELGDWRGGSASLDIYNNNVIDKRKLFPFQSYAIQNIEVPTAFKYGAVLRNFTSITTGQGDHAAVFSMIGPSETMFLLTDEQSLVRTWYDPTSDLTCYELSGTAQLDALHITVYVEMSSKDFILPICNSMHIILKDCNMTLSNPLMMQAGSIIEIKPTGTVNLENELYLYDKDQWGLYAHNYYFRSFNNLTSHKNRGAEDSKEGLDDAKLIVDGVLNVQNGGKIYTTAGGANVMGNGGGELHFKQALPGPERLYAVRVIGELPYIRWEYNDATAANLCNEDKSYTRSVGNATFYNNHGRWFHEEDKDEQEDHTYWFTYMIDDNKDHDVSTNAVYSHDKTGLEARMKWFNVEEDENCPNWWNGTNPTASYNYTILNDWHQFMATETEGVFSGSDNALYRKDDCDLVATGVVDENCLYTIDGVKKALVNGDFIPLTSNGYDPAYHATSNATQYYICFQGCNWHPATPYTGESKAYTIHPEDEDLHYIWFNNDWLNVLRDEPFFYTEDELTNVRTYYEYVNGEWEIATPYVSVTDAAETRTFYMIKEAFNVAQIKKNATITLLRDLPNVAEVLTYETQNTTCTLDLNGHLLGGALTNLITVNAPGATFTITDNSNLKLGKISNTASKAVYVKKGALVVANGTIESTSSYAIQGDAGTSISITGGYFAANTKCVNVVGSCTCSISGGHFTLNTGLANYIASHKYLFETTDPKYQWEVSDAWTITFTDGTTTLQTLHLKPGEMPIYTAAQPTKDGYKFTGWNAPIVAAEADATYTAQFETVAAGSKCVTLNSNGGDQGLQYIYVASGSAVGTLPETTKEGHTFAGWFTAASGGDQINEETTVSADVIWYAHYNRNSYTLTWNANGGELSGDYTQGSVQYGTTITKPTATFEGHTFIGWNVTPASTMPAANTTYTAQWSILAKHYLQNLDGTYPATPEATENVTGGAGEYVTPAVKTYDGFITPATQTVRIGEVSEVTYQYARRVYTITLNANGGTCATASLNVKHGATPELPSATKTGLSFDGWFTKAVGGDKITNETEILRNIGTLYAQFVDASLIISTTQTISDTREVPDLYVTTTGSLTITGSVTANNFILESNGATASGQLLPGTGTLTIAGNAYFDLKLNAKNHQWYAVAVPWNVDATSGISVNGRTLVLGKDFDIVYYDGDRRSKEGKQKCWSYVEDDVDKTLVPGRLYMIGLMGDAAVVRFVKKDGAALSTTTTSVEAHPQTTGTATDAGWNGVANPALFHAFVNPGTEFGQVYVPDEKRYEPTTLNTSKFVVGEGAFVEVSDGKDITVTPSGSFGAPRRAQAQANLIYDMRIAPAEAEYTDRLFIKTTDSREDHYTIGQDLAKVGVSSIVPQMWINRYDEKLCVNTAELINETAEYPLGIYVPANGEYTIHLTPYTSDSDYTLYLTMNGEAIWNLSDDAYTLTLDKGTTNAYGLRVSAPKISTAIDEAVVDADGQTRKMLIDNHVFIIRGDKVYTIDGQLVK